MFVWTVEIDTPRGPLAIAGTRTRLDAALVATQHAGARMNVTHLHYPEDVAEFGTEWAWTEQEIEDALHDM